MFHGHIISIDKCFSMIYRCSAEEAKDVVLETAMGIAVSSSASTTTTMQ